MVVYVDGIKLLDELSRKIISLVNLITEGTAEQPGNVITTAKTYLKSMSLVIDLMKEQELTDIEDMIKITEIIERLMNVKHVLDTKQYKKMNNVEEWIHKRLSYLRRDLNWIINKLDKLLRS